MLTRLSLQALGGCYSSAAKCWTDAIDSLCSALVSAAFHCDPGYRYPAAHASSQIIFQ